MTNKLRIRAKSLNLDLVGDPQYIMRAYDAIHPVLVERFEESVEGILDDAEFEHRPGTSTAPLHPVSGEPRSDDGSDGSYGDERSQHVNVVVCNDVYNKIYLVARDDVSLRIFDRVIDVDGVNRIYINRSQRDQFRGFFKRGKVLWRELTSAGKIVVKGA